MRARGYQIAPSSMEETTKIPAEETLHPNYPFLMSSHGLKSFDSHDDDDDDSLPDLDSDDQFPFSINTELLVDSRDVYIGELIGVGSSSKVYRGLWVFAFSSFQTFKVCIFFGYGLLYGFVILLSHRYGF